ncbi:MAG: hypothetical protein ABEJ27_02590 [Halodesulfurarchaeum sp.]
MARPPTATMAESTDRPTSPPAGVGDDIPTTEDVVVRNYDVERTYTLQVQAIRGDTEPAFEWTYHLGPGEFRGEIGVLEQGTYEIRVETNACGSDVKRCRIGPTARETVLIEVGNLAVNVSEGVY